MIDMDVVTELKEFADAVAKNDTDILINANVLSVLCSVYLDVAEFVNDKKERLNRPTLKKEERP